MNPREVTDLPYEERRIIVVAEKVPSAVAKPRFGDWDVAKAGAVAMLGGGALGLAGVALVRAIRDFRESGESIYPIDRKTARALRFPPGHPRQNVVYVGHPVDVGSYIPAADFHRFLFEHKVAEALRLARSLGARTVKVLHIQGWDREAAARLGLGLPLVPDSSLDVEIGANASRTDSTAHQVLTTMRLAPSGDPHIPHDLVWTPHEPLWMEIAAARMESGLGQVAIDVRSTDDFGVDAGLKALIAKAGLEAGGKFVEHQDTIWQLEADFLEGE
ncbi:hypothetical protein K8W59_01900 [Nocardioides rotundus]|uniref:hypothetical protein n=1 Tax=Nocardioides rotundus TaxID=1774216 RepID=UPI001CBAF8A4|nr:hypothetical protein [Nocardioides rotundus]UAL30319.1 hypothetical protein K8W59_01900 [Nocardioides rotundus]